LNFRDTRGELEDFPFSPQLNSSITGSVSSLFACKAGGAVRLRRTWPQAA